MNELKSKISESAVKENVRLAKGLGESKIDALKLKSQMNVNTAKEKITEKKAVDKPKKERRIVYLLDYADNRQQLAYAVALEAGFTILKAATEAADYIDKYGE